MNGQWLGTRKIRTNWATRKAATNEVPTAARNRGMKILFQTSNLMFCDLDSNNFQHGHESSAPKLDFNEVWNRTSDTNNTVYLGNCGDINEDIIRSYFEIYGQITEIRIFREKGYAFIR